MGKKDLRTCVLCHAQYPYCPVCNPEDQLKPTWYFCYCSDNCHDIDNITSAYEDGRMTAIEAKNKLEKLNLSKQEYFGESYQKSITSIMRAKTQVKKTTIKKENKKAEEKSVDMDIVTKGEENAESNVE